MVGIISNELYQTKTRNRPSKKCLINIQNIDDNECFKWCLVRYLHPAAHHPARTRNIDKAFAREFDFKDLKLLVKIRDI